MNYENITWVRIRWKLLNMNTLLPLPQIKWNQAREVPNYYDYSNFYNLVWEAICWQLCLKYCAIIPCTKRTHFLNFLHQIRLYYNIQMYYNRADSYHKRYFLLQKTREINIYCRRLYLTVMWIIWCSVFIQFI